MRDPKDPYLLAALGTTIFSGNLIAQTALRKSRPVVVVEEPGRNVFLPILYDNDNDPVQLGRSESGDISDEVSILISSPGSRAEASRGELTFSGDTTTSTRPTDISAVAQESASDIGLKQRRRTFGGKEKSQSRGEEEHKKGGGRRRSGGGRQKGGRGRNKKPARKTGEEEAERKLKKGKRQSTRKSHAAESRKGLASGKLKKQSNHLKSTLVSSAANSILRGAIGSSLKKSESWNENKDQFRNLNDVTDEPGNHLTMSFA